MITASYDQEHNTVIMEFSGKVDAVQTEKLYADIKKIVPKQGQGFKVLTDLTDVVSVDPKIKNSIKKLMDFLDTQGVTEVLRVIPDPSQDIGLNIMSPFHYSKDVQFVTVQTREEAQARL